MNLNTTQSTNQQRIIAALLVLLAAIFFSTKAVAVKLAYRHDVDSISLLALRMAFSLPLFLIVLSFSRSKIAPADVKPRDWIATVLVGVCGFYLAALFDFLGLQYITASLERLILFLYPTIVVLIGLFLFKEKINRTQVIALMLTYFGIAIAFLETLGEGESENIWLGAGLIFLCAIAYASYIVGSGQLVSRLGTSRFTSIAMISAGAAILIHHGIQYQWALFDFTKEVYFYALFMAIVSTVIPSFLISEGIRIIGSSNASIIGSIGPISTIVLAYIFLEERLGIIQWLGTLIVIIGVLIISLQKKKS